MTILQKSSVLWYLSVYRSADASTLLAFKTKERADKVLADISAAMRDDEPGAVFQFTDDFGTVVASLGRFIVSAVLLDQVGQRAIMINGEIEGVRKQKETQEQMAVDFGVVQVPRNAPGQPGFRSPAKRN